MDNPNNNFNEDSNEPSQRRSSLNINTTSLSPNRRSLFGNESLRRFNDGFEDHAMQPSSQSRITHLENVENVTNENGENVKRVRSVKELVGECPKIGSKEAFGRQVRETTEKSGNGVESFTDVKTESILGEDGTKLTRTSRSSRVKYSSGGRMSASSLFDNSRRENTMFNTDTTQMLNPYLGSTLFGRSSQFSTNLDGSSSSNQQPLASLQQFNSSSNHRFSDQGLSLVRSTPTIKEIVPPTFSYEIENFTIQKGGTAHFKGTVNGSYPFETVWYLDNKQLKPNNRISITMKQDCSETLLTGLIDYIISLKIFNCSYEDIGKYTAYVRNEAGDATCSAFLVIEGKLIQSF